MDSSWRIKEEWEESRRTTFKWFTMIKWFSNNCTAQGQADQYFRSVFVPRGSGSNLKFQFGSGSSKDFNADLLRIRSGSGLLQKQTILYWFLTATTQCVKNAYSWGNTRTGMLIPVKKIYHLDPDPAGKFNTDPDQKERGQPSVASDVLVSLDIFSWDN